jgi:hypothetical protein
MRWSIDDRRGAAAVVHRLTATSAMWPHRGPDGDQIADVALGRRTGARGAAVRGDQVKGVPVSFS